MERVVAFPARRRSRRPSLLPHLRRNGSALASDFVGRVRMQGTKMFNKPQQIIMLSKDAHTIFKAVFNAINQKLRNSALVLNDHNETGT